MAYTRRYGGEYGRILESFHSSIVQKLKADVLFPKLIEKHLLLKSERYQLVRKFTENGEGTVETKAEILFDMMLHKGPIFFELFIDVLQEDEREHHRDLARILKQELARLKSISKSSYMPPQSPRSTPHTESLVSYKQASDSIMADPDVFSLPDYIKSSMDTTPLLKHLYLHITPQYAADWKVIGTLLGLPSGELKAIEAGCPTNVKWCCNQMLEKWLEMDITASWRKLFAVIKSPAVSSGPNATPVTSKLDQLTITGDKGFEAVTILSHRVSQINVQTRWRVDEDTWPPCQTKGFTPLLLICYNSGPSLYQMTVAKLMHAGDISEVAMTRSGQSVPTKLDSDDTLQKTKEITEILAPLENSTKPHFILIEGAPGIGKTVLLKEIAFRWGRKELLINFELVLLLSLCDPILQQCRSISDLLMLFCRGDDREVEIAKSCGEYLFATGGRSLTILLDGYDEYPEGLRKSSLIAAILNRQILPRCGLVLSSRLHASHHLHKVATIRVEILGFTETERQHYIQQALEGNPHEITQVAQYLDKHPAINSLCYIPFTMVILLHLFNIAKCLPKNASELCHRFICLTIARHLAKSGNLSALHLTSVVDLPEPYNRVIRQLSKLSLQHLTSNTLVFSLDEIAAVCPDIATIPGAINGFGLLQTVHSLYTSTFTLNFVHFTIQEFLAAYYVTLLSPHEEFQVIEKNFWSDTHFKMFSMYMSLTKGQRSPFKRFISGGNKAAAICDKFLDDPLKCFRLYRCFCEAGDQHYCQAIERAKIFGRTVDLGYYRLTTCDAESISLFLTSSSRRQWVELNLWSCYIGDYGLRVLCRGLRHCNDLTITKLWLSNNGLTFQSGSLISEMVIKCGVEVLSIVSNNSIGEDQQLYSMLTHYSATLKNLIMDNVNLSSRAAINLFTALQSNVSLRKLFIMHNSFTDYACDAITVALRSNSCLEELNMSGNPISAETAQSILVALQDNNVLQLLTLPNYPDNDQEPFRSLQLAVNKKRESQGCQVQLKVKFAR